MYKDLALERIDEDKSPMSNTDIILMDIAYLLKDIREELSQLVYGAP